ncbi:MAG TPA: UDP-3-O-acyl-N-acetylglucosamine deacetylase [Candidatus Obscuribacterales bacterium]
MPGTTERTVKLTARGITSRREITTTVSRREHGHGIVFELPTADSDATVRIPTHVDYVVNTLRNVTLGTKPGVVPAGFSPLCADVAAGGSPLCADVPAGGSPLPQAGSLRSSTNVRLCIVEHFLSAAALWGLNDLLVHIDGPEFPLGDGGSKMWLDLFQEAGWERQLQQSTRELHSPITLQKGDRTLMAIPAETFSATYLMDWNHPAIGKCWYSWSKDQPVENVLDARTFGSLQEHQLLGIADEVVSLTADGFSQPLRFPDEPVRHKVLDLIGDLMLAGVNPQTWKARFISIKGGHEMDVELARELAKLV